VCYAGLGPDSESRASASTLARSRHLEQRPRCSVMLGQSAALRSVCASAFRHCSAFSTRLTACIRVTASHTAASPALLGSRQRNVSNMCPNVTKVVVCPGLNTGLAPAFVHPGFAWTTESAGSTSWGSLVRAQYRQPHESPAQAGLLRSRLGTGDLLTCGRKLLSERLNPSCNGDCDVE
jgi:hypothetical protein